VTKPSTSHDLRAALGAVVLQLEVARLALQRNNHEMLRRAIDTAHENAMRAATLIPISEGGQVMPRDALIIEDDDATREALAVLLEVRGFHTRTAHDLETAREALATGHAFDLVLTDLGLPDGDGLNLLPTLVALPNEPAVIVLTGESSLERAVEAMRIGATDFLTKPLDAVRLDIALIRTMQALDARDERTRLRRALKDAGRFHGLIGRSPAMRQVFERVEKAAPTELPVYIKGDSGTGKELLAQAVHRLSRRSKGPFIAVNCGGIPRQLAESELFGHEQGAFTGAMRRHEGAFERAKGGTLFLDELTEMPIDLQVLLLRVLEARTFQRVGGRQEIPTDVRVIAASNRNLEHAVRDGILREDIFFRLHVMPITMPLLRDRGADVLMLAEHFFEEAGPDDTGRVPTLSGAARAALLAHPWPGNVRELRNAILRGAVLCKDGVVSPEDLGLRYTPSDHRNTPANIHNRASEGLAPGTLVLPPATTVAEAERLLIRAALERHHFNRTAAAKELGLSVKTLYNRCRAMPDLADESRDPT